MGDLRPEEEKLVQWMVGYQAGSMDDFSSLYRALEKPLLRYLMTFVRNAAVADDLLQETFLQVHRARHTYIPPRPLKPWIYAVTRHVALMYLRSQRRRKESPPIDELPEVPMPPDIEGLADRATVERLLSRLPQEAREVVSLHHLLGLSFKEVGHVMGISPGAAKVRAHRALKTLREELADEGVNR